MSRSTRLPGCRQIHPVTFRTDRGRGVVVRSGLLRQGADFDAVLADAAQQIGVERVDQARSWHLSDHQFLPGGGVGVLRYRLVGPAEMPGGLPEAVSIGPSRQLLCRATVFSTAWARFLQTRPTGAMRSSKGCTHTERKGSAWIEPPRARLSNLK